MQPSYRKKCIKDLFRYAKKTQNLLRNLAKDNESKGLDTEEIEQAHACLLKIYNLSLFSE